MEWPFSFQTGPGKTAVMQISPDLNTSYVFGFSKIDKLPMSVCVLLSHPKVRLTGVNIKKYSFFIKLVNIYTTNCFSDVHKLGRDFKVASKDKMLENCIDSGVFANEVLPVRQRWSMEKLVGYLVCNFNYFFYFKIVAPRFLKHMARKGFIIRITIKSFSKTCYI